MSEILKITGAANLALHAVSYLAVHKDREPIATSEIAEQFKVSEDHLRKVFQRLTRSGIVETTRGPHGGIRLKGNPDDITLLHVYESMEGPLTQSGCILGTKKCNYDVCILGDLFSSVNEQIRDYFGNTRLSALASRLAEHNGIDA
jgi:Rrf2 family protein